MDAHPQKRPSAERSCNARKKSHKKGRGSNTKKDQQHGCSRISVEPDLFEEQPLKRAKKMEEVEFQFVDQLQHVQPSTRRIFLDPDS